MPALRARWVVPIAAPPIAGGFVAFSGNTITYVGSQRPAGLVDDRGDVALLPGLVNAHAHLEYSERTHPLGNPQSGFAGWIRDVIAWKRSGACDPPRAIVRGLAESRAAGVALLGEIASPGWPAAAASEFLADGQRGLTVFQEWIATSPERFPAEDSLPPPTSSLFPAVSPHAPYTVHGDLLQRAVRAAIAGDFPLAMHLAESREELELIAHRRGPLRILLEELGVWNPAAYNVGTTILDYLRCLAAAPRTLAIHGNYLTSQEISFLAAQRQRMSVVYCPRTHAWFGHPAHPLLALLDAGVHVALGTDGRGSNPDLDLWQEMQFVARHYPSLTTERILRLGTLDGAIALGREQAYGALSPGRTAVFREVSLPAGQDSLEQLFDR